MCATGEKDRRHNFVGRDLGKLTVFFILVGRAFLKLQYNQTSRVVSALNYGVKVEKEIAMRKVFDNCNLNSLPWRNEYEKKSFVLSPMLCNVYMRFPDRRLCSKRIERSAHRGER